MEEIKTICKICGKNKCGSGYDTCFPCNQEAKGALKQDNFKTAKEIPPNNNINTNRSFFLSYAKDLIVAGRLQMNEVQDFLESCEKYTQTGVFQNEQKNNSH